MEWLIRDITAELKSWGHQGGEGGRIILKSDGEKSIKALRDAVGRYLGGEVITEESAKGESQSNGRVEEAGKTVRGFARVLKEQIEDKAKVKLGPEMAVIQWIIRWAAMLTSRFLVGKDGKTAYERRRGRRCQIPCVPFGEKVWYKELRENKRQEHKMESEWAEGIWLGHNRSSNEIIVGTRKGAVRAYAIRRKLEEDRWDAQMITEIRGTPQQPDPNKVGDKSL